MLSKNVGTAETIATETSTSSPGIIMQRKNPPSADTALERFNIHVPEELYTRIKMSVPFDISRKQFLENLFYEAARASRSGANAREQDPQSTILDTHDTEAQNIPSLVTRSISSASEGQKLFLSIACVLDMLLTSRHGVWQHIINDETDKTSEGFLLNGRLCFRTIATKIVDEFPVVEGGADRQKTTEKHVKQLAKFLTQEQDHLVDLSAQAKPKAYRTLFGLARATW
jgi:hypothetical protein